MRPQKEAPVLVFDSGLGGLTVLAELVRQMPEEDYLYFADAANAPYGEKTIDQVRRLTFAQVEQLMEVHRPKALVVACNTATSAAIDLLRAAYPAHPVIGMEPALKPAVLHAPHPKVLVLATPMTLREEKFHRLLDSYRDGAEVLSVPCPGLAEMIDQGHWSDPELLSLLRSLLADALDPPPEEVVLGCTHYPLVEAAIREAVGAPVEIFQGGPGTAREAARRLVEADLRREEGQGKVRFLSSLEDPAWEAQTRQLFPKVQRQLQGNG